MTALSWPDMIEAAVHFWHQYVNRRKLIENMSKLQKVACVDPHSEGYGRSMEVLGAIGLDGPLGYWVPDNLITVT